MTGKDLVRLLERHDCEVSSVRGSHFKMTKNGKSVPVPVHAGRDVPAGTLHKILKETGLK